MDQLERLIENIARRMIRITRSPNLYLASVHYEALRNYLDYLDDRFFMRLARTGKVKISSLLPVGKFACGDVTLNEQIRELMSQLRPPNAQRGRKLVLVYGPSSVGKSYLVEQLFEQFGQGPKAFEDRRLICTQNIDFTSAIGSLVDAAKATTLARPFIFIDEADTEVKTSIFPTILKLVDEGKLESTATQLDSFVLFWGGGKFGTIKALRDFLKSRQKSVSFQKGFDVFNRSTLQIELPARLLTNRSHKVALGLAQLATVFPPPVSVEWKVIQELRKMSLPTGVREMRNFPSRLEKQDDVVVLKSDTSPKQRFIHLR